MNSHDDDICVGSISTVELVKMRRKIESLTTKNERLRDALEFYADPEIYKPHPHGLAFDYRDVSYVAIKALRGA